MKKLIPIASMLILAAGCATNEPTKMVACDVENWEELGQQTALSGRSVRTIDAYRSSCEDLDDDTIAIFVDGYLLGLLEFCTYENGYKHGNTNISVRSDICPHEIREQYALGYRDGQRNRGVITDDMDRAGERGHDDWTRENADRYSRSQ